MPRKQVTHFTLLKQPTFEPSGRSALLFEIVKPFPGQLQLSRWPRDPEFPYFSWPHIHWRRCRLATGLLMGSNCVLTSFVQRNAYHCLHSACVCMLLNTLRPRQDGRHFPDDIFKCIFPNENAWLSIKISLKFVPKGPINNIPSLDQIMAWRHQVDKPLSEPMMVWFLTHICTTQWVDMMGMCKYRFGVWSFCLNIQWWWMTVEFWFTSSLKCRSPDVGLIGCWW